MVRKYICKNKPSRLAETINTDRLKQLAKLPPSGKKNVRFEHEPTPLAIVTVKDEGEGDDKKKKLSALLDLITTLAHKAIESTLAANDGDFKGFEQFKFELASMCVDQDSIPPDVKPTTRNKRLQDMNLEIFSKLSALDPLIARVFVNAADSA